MSSSRLYWPSDRKLFRQRSRLRFLLPAVLIGAAALALLAFGHPGWL